LAFEIELSGEKAMSILDALASEASFRALQLLSKEKLDVSTIARRLGFSQAHISEEVNRLQKIGLIKVSYEPGKRGTRKICELAVSKIIISIKTP
jgi:predicted transcriptional regulator